MADEYDVDPGAIVRPFWPGGDYERHDYPAGCVVLDNPPFSIISEIARFYEGWGISYFLFAPTLTNLQIPASCHIITGVPVTYDNGAKVSTSFVTNLDQSLIRTAPELRRAVAAEDLKNKQTRTLPVYNYPINLITAAKAGYLSRWGVELRIAREDGYFVRRLDAMQDGKGIFGGGFLLTEKAAAEKAAAEKAADYTFRLSAREMRILEHLERGELIETD